MNIPAISNPPRLSLCMIVKDEERFLPGCLESIAEFVDEIVIADTGSTDRTLQIAQAHKAKICRIEWQDDFAAARNAALGMATGDWILQLDADERLRKEGSDELRSWLARNDVLYVSLPINSPGGHSGKGHISRAHRLFRNLPGVCYSGKIHEQVSPFFVKYRLKEGISRVMIEHLGYSKDVVDMDQKLNRNRRILELEVADNPDNAFGHFNLAQNMMLQKQYEQALAELEQAMQIGGLPDDILCSCCNNMAQIYTSQQNYHKALQSIRNSLDLNSEQTTAFLLQYEIYEQTGERTKQIAVLERLVDLVENESSVFHKTSLQAYVDPADIYLNLANRYFDASLYIKAAETYHKHLDLKPDQLPVLKALAECYLFLTQYKDALEIYEHLLQMMPEDFAILDRIALIAIKLGMNDKAVLVYEHLLKLAPRNHSVRKRLAALLLQTGSRERALQILSGKTAFKNI